MVNSTSSNEWVPPTHGHCESCGSKDVEGRLHDTMSSSGESIFICSDCNLKPNSFEDNEK